VPADETLARGRFYVREYPSISIVSNHSVRGRSTAGAQSAGALIQQSANAMGGVTALRALKTQVIESEGKQFESSSTLETAEFFMLTEQRSYSSFLRSSPLAKGEIGGFDFFTA